MGVRAKFYIAEAHVYPGGTGKVVLRPAARGAENRSWTAATPSGEFTMTVNNPEGFAWFHARIGEELYIDMTPAGNAQADDGHDYIDTPAGHYNSGRCERCGGDEAQHVKAGG